MTSELWRKLGATHVMWWYDHGTPESTLSKDAVRSEPLDALAQANAIILRSSCDYLGKAVADIPRQFKQMRRAGTVTIWVRQ